MVEVLLRKRPGGLEPASDEAYQILSRLGAGSIIVADIKDPRRTSSDQHRFWFAMVKEMFEAQEYFKTFLHFRRAVLIKMGYRHEYHLKDGTAYFEAKSVKFSNMGEAEFNRLVDETLDLAVEMGFDREELLAHCRNEIPSVY